MADHFYVNADILPKDTDSQDEWERRVVMLADMMTQMSASLFEYVRINAPMLLAPDQFGGHFISGLGLLAQGIRDTGRAQLQKRGQQPLSIEDDQLRMIRDRLANPAIAPEEREFLLTLLAHNLECTEEHRAPVTETAPNTDDADFPEGGFVIGGEE